MRRARGPCRSVSISGATSLCCRRGKSYAAGRSITTDIPRGCGNHRAGRGAEVIPAPMTPARSRAPGRVELAEGGHLFRGEVGGDNLVFVNRSVRGESAMRSASAEHSPEVASLRELVDSVPALIDTGLPDGHLDYFNQRWLEFVGLRSEDLEGWKWTATIHPDDVSALVASWRDCLETGRPLEIEARVRRADGAYRWTLHQKRPVRDASGQIVRWYGCSVDIEDRRGVKDKI